MKKILFCIISILILCTSGCSQSPETTKTVIKFSSWGSQSETAIIKSLLSDFEKQNPDIKVELLHIPQNYFQKIHLLFASNLAPDIIFINNYFAPKYIKANLLEDLKPYFSNELEQKVFFEKSVMSFSYKNSLYAVPRDVSSLVVYYNKDMFKRKKISFPEQDWTIQDFINTGEKLTDTKNRQWGTGLERDLLFLQPFLYSNNLYMINQNGEIGIEEAAEQIQLYTDIVNKYHIAPSKAQTASLTMAQMFIQQRIAMHISGRWLVPKYREEAKFDWDIINFPAGSAGSVTNIDASGYAIAKSSKHKSESIKLIKFLTSKSSMQQLAKSGLIVPARKDAAYSDSFLSADKKPAHAEVFLSAAENGIPTGVNENYQQINDILTLKLEPVFEGEKEAYEVIDKNLLKQLNNHKSVNR